MMHFLHPTVLLLTLSLTSAAHINTLASRQESACTQTHIFLAKGNNEPYPGRQGKLVNAICAGLPSCDYEDILFYNPVESSYCASVIEGVANGISQITAYNKRCPDSNLVVSGYSQGAHIVGDILGGSGGVFFQGCVQGENAGLDFNSPAGKKIAAAMVWGNTRHTGSQPYDVYTGAGKDGLFPRPAKQLATLSQWTPVFHDYCVVTDPICAGGKNVSTHLNYFDVYTDDAAQWVKKMVGSAAQATPLVSSTSSSSPTSTSSSLVLSATSLSASAIPSPSRSIEVTVSSASVSLTSTADSPTVSSSLTVSTPTTSLSTSATSLSTSATSAPISTTSSPQATSVSTPAAGNAAGTATSSSRSAGATSHAFNLLGLAVAGSFAICL